MRLIRYATAAALAAMVAACELEVTNVSNPDRNRILQTPADAEELAAAQFQQITSAMFGALARTHTSMLTMSFENASGLANNGLGPRSNFPRAAIDNGRGNPYQLENFNDYTIYSAVARNGADILFLARDSAFKLAADTAMNRRQKQRLFAWLHFVYGVALGNVSLIYDSTAVPRPGDAPLSVQPLEGYVAVHQVAIQALDSALAWASRPGTLALPGPWLLGPGASNSDTLLLRRVIRSYRARLRAGVARTPADRAAVDWNAVIADANAGITSDISVNMSPAQGWDYPWLASTQHYRDVNWHQMPYHIIGMADSTRAYDTWLQTHRDQRAPFLIVTADLRFPQGTTRTAQNNVAAGGQGAPSGRRYFRNRSPGGDATGVGWRNSQYDHYRFRAFADAGRNGPFPLFTKAENDMLAAEGYIRTGNIAAAATLIDRTRTTAGLPALTGAVTTATDPVPGGTTGTPVPGGASCVPRVPVGPTFTTTACGNIMEAMKWEKRMETAYTTNGAWYFDSRGWGDLALGTTIHWPVPNQELDSRLKPIYNLGGVNQPGGATVSNYGFGTGNL